MIYHRFIISSIFILLLGSTFQGKQLKCKPRHSPSRKKIDFPLGDNYSILSTIYDNIVVVVDNTDRGVAPSLRNSGSYQQYSVATLSKFIKDGDTILNIGSQFGQEAMILGKLAGPTGKLIIFQPYLRSFKALEKGIYLNSLQKITTIYKYGASNKASDGYLVIQYFNTGGNHVYDQEGIKKIRQAGKYDQIEKIQIRRADQIIPKDIKIDFALLDVQGLELQVLEGLQKVIQRSPNMVIASEWFGKDVYSRIDYLPRLKALITWFMFKNYKFYHSQIKDMKKLDSRNCPIEKFIQLSSLDQVLQFGKYVQTIRGHPPPDLFFVPAHINPDSVY